MVLVLLNLPAELDKQIKLYQVTQGVLRKDEAIIKLLYKVAFNNKHNEW